jgi:hypothetical protein
MLPFIAIPLLHSSGAWIASTAAGGYITGTLATTWIGAFIAGNAGLLSGLGITSAAGVYAAFGGTLSSAGTAVGTGLTTVGLSGLAQSLGLAPATFLGLTFVSWAVVASVILIFSASGLIYFFARGKLQIINVERSKGGLPNITWRGILKEAQDYERQSMIVILAELDKECKDLVYLRGSETVEIKGVNYNIRDLKYVVEKNGTERIVKSSLIPFRRIVVYTAKRGQGVKILD